MVGKGGVENAPIIPGFFGVDEWGGCNQAYLLDTGLVGMIGHKCYKNFDAGGEILTYMNTSFVFDPSKHEVLYARIIGTRNWYPAGRNVIGSSLSVKVRP